MELIWVLVGCIPCASCPEDGAWNAPYLLNITWNYNS